MRKKEFVLQIGQGTSLQSNDYSKAGVRAVQNALWRNSLNFAQAFGLSRKDMLIDVTIAVQKPEEIDKEVICRVFPYGLVSVKAKYGGLDIPKTQSSSKTIIAVAAIVVSFDIGSI